MKDGFFYFVLLTACILCAIYCNMTTSEPELMSVRQQQQMLVSKGYTVKIDGKFGPETDLALSRYLNRQETK